MTDDQEGFAFICRLQAVWHAATSSQDASEMTYQMRQQILNNSGTKNMNDGNVTATQVYTTPCKSYTTYLPTRPKYPHVVSPQTHLRRSIPLSIFSIPIRSPNPSFNPNDIVRSTNSIPLHRHSCSISDLEYRETVGCYFFDGDSDTLRGR